MAWRLVVFLFFFCSTVQAIPPRKDAKSTKDLQREESTDYYKKWLKEDVVYIISDEELAVFGKLTADEERDAFIEQFWVRRDTDQSTGINEFREEHYRRIAYANERFTSGLKGWVTDRGRVYITFGKPDGMEAKPSGGRYQREMHEGGGSTNVYPFERWWYRDIPGVGSDIELEFVDTCFCGDYHLAMDMWEKDAEMVGGGERTGLTFREMAGLTSKLDRPYFNPESRNRVGMMGMMGIRQKDRLFQRIDRYFKILSPPEIKFKDLKSDVDSKVFYRNLPSLRYTYDFVQLNSIEYLVPITVQIDNKEFQFTKVPNQDLYRAHLSLYGRLSTLTGRTRTEFDDEVVIDYKPEELQKGRLQKAAYQKIVVLPPGLFKLNLIARGRKSGKLGSLEGGITIPRIDPEKLQGSSLFLAHGISTLDRIPDGPEMFVLGDLKVFPSADGKFLTDHTMNVYFNLYNIGIDQASGAPSLEISYEVVRGGKVVNQLQEREGSLYAFSKARTVILNSIPLKELQPGAYKLRVTAVDKVKNERVQIEETFTVTS